MKPSGQSDRNVVPGHRAAIAAMQKLVGAGGRFGGTGPGCWTFDGHPIDDDVAQPLLFLTDELNQLGSGPE